MPYVGNYFFSTGWKGMMAGSTRHLGRKGSKKIPFQHGKERERAMEGSQRSGASGRRAERNERRMRKSPLFLFPLDVQLRAGKETGERTSCQD